MLFTDIVDSTRRASEVGDRRWRDLGARVGAKAEAGEVLVSQTVKDLVAGSGFAFEDRCEHELKGVPGAWRLYAVGS